MPDLVEQMYCSQQIFIPPNLPSILKKYAKAAIRTQPGDLLTWSSAYFRALAEGIPPPAKDRIEYPPVDTPSGLSPGFLKVLINQIGKRETIHRDVLAERWKGVCLNPKALQDLLDVGMFEDEVSWLEFLAICVGTLEPSLTRTMIELCELLTDEPEGGRAAIPVAMFLNLYKYLAKLDCGPVNRLEDYEKTLKTDSETQCQATDLKPTEEEEEAERTNIDWDTAIGDMPVGDDVDEGIVIEAAEIEDEGRGDDAGEQGEVPITENESPESEGNTEAVEEEVSKIEVMNDAQLRNASDDVETEETGVSEEPEGATNLDNDTKENEVQNVESAPLTVAGNGATEEEKGEVDNDGIDDVGNGGNEEKTDEVAVADGDEKEGDTAQIEEDGDAVDKAADAATEEGDVEDDGGALNTDVSQLEKAVDEAAGVDETAGTDEYQGGQGENEADNLTANDDTEKQNAVEGVVENGEESSEQPDAVDDTKDEKVDSTTPEEIPVESNDSPGEGNEGEKEEFVKADEGTTEIDETLKGDDANEKTTTEVASVIATSADEPTDVAPDEADAPSSDQGETEETGNQADVVNSTTAGEVAQGEATDVAQGEADAPSSDQGETEETGNQADVTNSTTAGEVAQDEATDVAQGEADAPSSDQGKTEETGNQADVANSTTADEVAQDEATDVSQGEADAPSSDRGETEETPNQADVDNSTTASEIAQDQAEDGAQEVVDSQSLNNGETEELTPQENITAPQDPAEKKADDPPSDQGETEEIAPQADLTTASSADDAPQEQAEDAAQDEPSPIQTESEQPAAEDAEDQKESTDAVDDVQNVANQSREDDKDGTDDGNGLENTESADAVPEENATSENSASANVEQKTEDENGNDNTLLNVEEIIDPKVAYIVNDDGTLSAPRAESVVDEDALKERDSDNSVYTKVSDDGMIVWPDIKPQDKEEGDPEPLLEKEVTSEDGLEVFTDVEAQAHQEELKLVAEQQEEEPVEAEQEENIFAPQIDSFTDLLEAESAPVEEANPEQLAAAIESTELIIEDSGRIIPSVVLISEAESDEEATQGPAETVNVPSTEAKAEEGDQKREKKPRRQRKDVEIESLVKKDSDMMLLPTPITSDIMLYMDGACDKTGVKLSQTQQLNHKMSMIDVQVFVPVDETIVEVVQEHRYPKWMHIPGIGPTVPEHIIEEAENYFVKIAELQEGMVMPRNVKHFHCPPLELVPDCPDGAAEGV